MSHKWHIYANVNHRGHIFKIFFHPHHNRNMAAHEIQYITDTKYKKTTLFYFVLGFIVKTESLSGDFWTAEGIYRLIALLVREALNPRQLEVGHWEVRAVSWDYIYQSESQRVPEVSAFHLVAVILQPCCQSLS